MANHSTARGAGTGGQQALFCQAARTFFPRDADRATIEPVAGGFSGSPLAKVVLPSGKCWAAKGLPQGIDAPRGRWVHGLMRHLRETSLPFIPEVAEASPGVTLWQDPRGRFWEMLAWMPGRPRLQPSEAERTAGLQAVAALHVAAARFSACPMTVGVPASLTERVEQCRQLLQRGWPLLGDAAAETRTPADESERRAFGSIHQAFAAAAAALTARGARALRRVAGWQPEPEPLLAVVRDLTADHLLFADAAAAEAQPPPRVTGLIDFHAARLDTPACDLARLIASLHGGIPANDAIQESVACYAESLAQLGEPQPSVAGLCRRVELLAATGVILGLDNWMRWIRIEERQFADWEAVATRVERHAAAVGPALDRLAAVPLQPPFRR